MKKVIVTLIALFMGATASAENKKVLIVLSSENKITLKDGITHPTGYFLSELGIPLKALIEAGYEPVFATPKGNAPTMDIISDSPFWFEGSETMHNEIKKLVNSFSGVHYPFRLSDVLKMDINEFSGVFVAGGHAPMEDLISDKDLGQLLRRFHQAQKPTALICHGPIALLSAQDRYGNWPYAGYKMTSFSTAEEQQEEPGQDNALGGYVKFYPDQALSAAGAEISVAIVFKKKILVS